MPPESNNNELEHVEQVPHQNDAGRTDADKQSQQFGFDGLSQHNDDGRLSVVTAIIKARIVPSCAPFASRASATGMVPKISAYIGTPTRVARSTPKGLLLPKTAAIQLSGIQLWITAPMP